MHRLRSMKIGTVQLWLLLLLSDKPMYGYETIRELERRFSGYWSPKTGTIYPALEKLEETGLVTGQMESRDHGPDRKHYALTDKGKVELKSAMAQWAKMTEMIDTYRETHQALFKFRKVCTQVETAKMLTGLGTSFENTAFELSDVFASEERRKVELTEPVVMKLLYAKEDHKYEIHIELEWLPRENVSADS
ncbi:MAG: PadR family transcriptional regulator [Candidatus Atabeyarchaeum deiterrae]